MAKQCLNNCCCCCTLETGGLVIGWINIIFGFLGFIGSIIMVVFSAGALNVPGISGVEEALWITMIVIFSIYIVFTLIYAIAGILLVIGTKRREHGKMVLMLFLMGLGVILSFIQLFTGANAATITSSILVALLQLYFFICIFSLYAMIKNENEGKG
ncbi:hypothetical protein PVAND_006138 [Polypedilum vanderplanki]|uniref:Uncharacterized protein n=1 Tax=Polypedilum vanderplanki TaxID=319348 RepID=A0A9J6C2P0_POLVA|nr:hypothetical protein PVAND_006138 [Polypedilum vanderplanki]